MIAFPAASASAQSGNDGVSIAMTVDRMMTDEGLMDCPVGYYLNIKDGKASAYIPFWPSEQYQTIRESVTNGLLMTDEPVEISITEKKHVRVLSFTVLRDMEKLVVKLELPGSERAALTIRSRNHGFMQFTGTVSY